MSDSNPQFLWGRPNPNYTGPTKASQDSGQMSFSDVMGDFIAPDEAIEDSPDEVTFGKDTRENNRILREFIGNWAEESGNADSAGMMIRVEGSPEKTQYVKTEDLLNNPSFFIPPTSPTSGSKADISEGYGEVIVDYHDDRRGVWSIYPIADQAEFEFSKATYDERSISEIMDPNSERAYAAREARTMKNIEKFDLASGGDKEFLITGHPQESYRSSKRTYTLDAEKVREMGMGVDSVHDYMSRYVGKHLFGGNYDPRSGTYSGFRD